MLNNLPMNRRLYWNRKFSELTGTVGTAILDPFTSNCFEHITVSKNVIYPKFTVTYFIVKDEETTEAATTIKPDVGEQAMKMAEHMAEEIGIPTWGLVSIIIGRLISPNFSIHSNISETMEAMSLWSY